VNKLNKMIRELQADKGQKTSVERTRTHNSWLSLQASGRDATHTATAPTTCLENLEMSGNLTAVREMSGILLKIMEMSGKNLVREKLPKTVYCKLHICVHTGIQ